MVRSGYYAVSLELLPPPGGFHQVLVRSTARRALLPHQFGQLGVGTVVALRVGRRECTMALLATRALKNPSDWSDRELLKCVLRNDARAWSELVRRYRPLIYRCITKVTLKY